MLTEGDRRGQQDRSDTDGAGLARLQAEMKQLGIPVYPISAAAAKGVKELMSAVKAMLDTLPPSQPVEEEGIIEEWAIGENDLNFEVSRHGRRTGSQRLYDRLYF